MSVRDVDERAAALPAEQWLHLDVSMGVSGDMLTGALLDLGLDVGILRSALDAVGLAAVGPRAKKSVRRGVAGTELVYVDARGRAIEHIPMHADGDRGAARQRAARPERTGRHVPHRDRRPAPETKAVAREIDAEAGADRSIDVGLDDERGGPERPPPPSEVEGWLVGEGASALRVQKLLASSHLAPIPRTLARKAMRRLLEAKARSMGIGLDDLVLDGPGAVDMLADVVGVAALVSALNPAMITASPVALSSAPVRIDGVWHPGPAPWTLGALEGIRTREVDADYGVTTPTGAALVWALAHRVGTRPESVVERVGVGLGSFDPPDRVNCCRAFVSPPLPLPSTAGAPRSGSFVELEAAVAAGTEVTPLGAALVREGGLDVTLADGKDLSGSPLLRVSLIAPEDRAGPLGALLLELPGCRGVRRRMLEYEALGIREVTVPIGPRHARHAVRVEERLLGEKVLDFTPSEEDVSRAASALGVPRGEVRREAYAAYGRLVTAPAGEGEER